MSRCSTTALAVCMAELGVSGPSTPTKGCRAAGANSRDVPTLDSRSSRRRHFQSCQNLRVRSRWQLQACSTSLFLCVQRAVGGKRPGIVQCLRPIDAACVRKGRRGIRAGFVLFAQLAVRVVNLWLQGRWAENWAQAHEARRAKGGKVAHRLLRVEPNLRLNRGQ